MSGLGFSVSLCVVPPPTPSQEGAIYIFLKGLSPFRSLWELEGECAAGTRNPRTINPPSWEGLGVGI